MFLQNTYSKVSVVLCDVVWYMYNKHAVERVTRSVYVRVRPSGLSASAVSLF